MLRGARRRPIARTCAWEAGRALDARTAALLPGLLLARIDGKSPVEYLTTMPRAGRPRIRARRLAAPDATLAQFCSIRA